MGKASFTADRIKAVFFDINETLLDPGRSFHHAFSQVWEDMCARWDGQKPDAAELWESYQTHWRAWKNPGGRKDSWAESQKRNMSALTAAVREHHLRLGEGTLHGFFQKVMEHQEKSPLLYPGAAETLAALSRTYKLAIISNGIQEKQTRKLRAAGQIPPLREEHMFFSAAVGARKPDPVIFRHALDKMGLRPNQTVMVGNSWAKDVLGAVHVHMNVVWFRPDRKQKHFRRKVGSARIHVVQSMEELLSLFET
ncbi:MAG: family hydrolase [Paenibacillaceae bacterium]|jgi:putative hydrolase of the HAD superfamily|nr:family hydrolase [Paenibacillaceae bacterium]